MINIIPVFGWFVSLFFAISLSVPFWICWTVAGLGEKYFYFLPDIYHRIPFWHCVGLFTILSVLKVFVPKLVSVEQDQTVKKDHNND